MVCIQRKSISSNKSIHRFSRKIAHTEESHLNFQTSRNDKKKRNDNRITKKTRSQQTLCERKSAQYFWFMYSLLSGQTSSLQCIHRTFYIFWINPITDSQFVCVYVRAMFLLFAQLLLLLIEGKVCASALIQCTGLKITLSQITCSLINRFFRSTDSFLVIRLLFFIAA